MTDNQEDDVPQQEDERQPVFNIPAVVVALTVACVIIHLVRLYVLSVEQDIGLLLRAAFIPIRYSGQFDLDIYAFTSPFTYTLLHGSVVHLAINMVWLAAFGSPLANRLGVGRFLLFWAATGVAAAVSTNPLHMVDQSPQIGASGHTTGAGAPPGRRGAPPGGGRPAPPAGGGAGGPPPRRPTTRSTWWTSPR